MSPKELTAFRISPELLDAMREIKTREGLPISVQVDFALKAWLESKGVIKSDRKRAVTRKRS